MEETLETKEIGDILNPERELEILESEKEGIETDPLYAHLNPESCRDDDILQLIKWCKTIELVKERTNNNDITDTPQVIVLGGAGSGKSTVIKTWDQNSFNCRG